VPILSSEDVKTSLVCFVGDTISDFGAEHHLIAAHKVVHHILQRRLKSLFVDQIEEYLEIGGDLDSDVSFDVVDEAPTVNDVVLFPLPLLSILVHLNFEKQDVAGAASD